MTLNELLDGDTLLHAITSNSLIATLFGPGALRRAPEFNLSSRADRTDLEFHNRFEQPADTMDISGAALAESRQSASQRRQSEEEPSNPQGLTEEEQAQVEKLKQRDREVRRHEQAHMAAAGGFARGGPSYEYETGPDGKQYAVAGEVSIDTSPIPGNPQATIAKMQQIQRAALAPAQPSSQDRAVAAQARAAEQEARRELAEEKRASKDGLMVGTATTAQHATTRGLHINVTI